MKKFPAKIQIPHLFRFLAPMNVADITVAENNFSISDLSSTETLLMIGPTSFENYSCKSKASYDSQQKERLLYIKLGAKCFLPGHELSVFYSAGFLVPN